MAFLPREAMRTIWRVLSRIAFWSYERGTWPYDVAVAAIVVFVLFSPRSWFHDQPAVGPPSAQTLVVLESSDGAGPTQTYSVDARLLASPIRTPELEHDLHDAMRKNTESLRHGNFRILRIEPIRGEGDTVVSYEVTISP
jgi:hypothetical protein